MGQFRGQTLLFWPGKATISSFTATFSYVFEQYRNENNDDEDDDDDLCSVTPSLEVSLFQKMPAFSWGISPSLSDEQTPKCPLPLTTPGNGKEAGFQSFIH